MMSKRISQLANSGALNGTELVPVVQSGNTRKTTTADIAALASGSSLQELVRDTIGTALVAGSNITITVNDPGDTITIAGAAGGSAWEKVFLPSDNEPPFANFATMNIRNQRPNLQFDTTTAEAAVFSMVIPQGYANTGFVVDVWCDAATATSGTIGWTVEFERVQTGTLDDDADSFGTVTTITAVAVSGTSGVETKMSANVAHADLDGAVAGERIRIRIKRDVANDTAAGDAGLYAIRVRAQ
jgi:hypothetical protein